MFTARICPKFVLGGIPLEPGGQTYFDTNATYKEIVTYDGPQVEKGFIRVSEKPGIGVEINEEGGSPRPG